MGCYFNNYYSEIYAAIGYLVVRSAYIEDCIDHVYEKIIGKDNIKMPAATKLIEINKKICGQTNLNEFHIKRTEKFFDDRNHIVHRQIYGKNGSRDFLVNHKRQGVHGKIGTLEEIKKITKEGDEILRIWLRLRRIKEI